MIGKEKYRQIGTEKPIFRTAAAWGCVSVLLLLYSGRIAVDGAAPPVLYWLAR